MIISMTSHLRAVSFALVAFLAFPSSAVQDNYNLNQTLRFFNVNDPSPSNFTDDNAGSSRNFKLKDLGWNNCLNVTYLHLSKYNDSDPDSKPEPGGFFVKSFYFDDPNNTQLPGNIANACRFYYGPGPGSDNCSGSYTDVFSNTGVNIPPQVFGLMSVKCVQNEKGNLL